VKIPAAGIPAALPSAAAIKSADTILATCGVRKPGAPSALPSCNAGIRITGTDVLAKPYDHRLFDVFKRSPRHQLFRVASYWMQAHQIPCSSADPAQICLICTTRNSLRIFMNPYVIRQLS